MSKFKAGDLALVVSGSTSSVNVGRTVLLLESRGSPVFYEWDGERYHNANGDHIWIIEAQGEALVTRFGYCAKRGLSETSTSFFESSTCHTARKTKHERRQSCPDEEARRPI